MSSRGQETQPVPLLDTPHALKAFWRLPSPTIARFTLVSYMRSGWLLGDIILIWRLYAIFFPEFGGNVAYFYGTATQELSVVTILGTVVMV